MSEVLAANYGRIEALYLDAARVATAANPGQRARLEFFGDNLVIMQWNRKGRSEKVAFWNARFWRYRAANSL